MLNIELKNGTVPAIINRRAINARLKAHRSLSARAFILRVVKRRNTGILLRLDKMRHVSETRHGISPYVGEHFRSPVGVVELRTMENRTDELYPNCKKCALKGSPELCSFAECFLVYQKKTDQHESSCFGYYAKIEEGENNVCACKKRIDRA